jgi:hypothetical protein
MLNPETERIKLPRNSVPYHLTSPYDYQGTATSSAGPVSGTIHDGEYELRS